MGNGVVFSIKLLNAFKRKGMSYMLRILKKKPSTFCDVYGVMVSPLLLVP